MDASSALAVIPAGPPPMTAIRHGFFSVGGVISGGPFWASQSATNRSRRPMATGACLRPTMQSCSHWVSWGQTRPQAVYCGV